MHCRRPATVHPMLLASRIRAADRHARDPVRLNTGLAQGVVDSGLIGAERTATLQHQRDNFERKVLCRLHDTRLDLSVHANLHVELPSYWFPPPLPPGDQVIERIDIWPNEDGDPGDRAPENYLIAHLILLLSDQCAMAAAPPSLTLRSVSASGTAASEISVRVQNTSTYAR